MLSFHCRSIHKFADLQYPIPVHYLGDIIKKPYSGFLKQFIRIREKLWQFLCRHRRSVLIHEAAFLLPFVLYLWFRSYVPDATFDINFYGAEKWGNLALLTSLWRNPDIPPVDHWLAGYPENYYYFGHLVWATVARLTWVTPEVAFNLGLATLFSLLITLSFSAGRAVSGRKSGGGWAVIFLVFAGPFSTLSQVPQLLAGWRRGGS